MHLPTESEPIRISYAWRRNMVNNTPKQVGFER